MKPEERKRFLDLPPARCMALAAFGEARGESDEGVAAVLSVVLNRMDYGLEHAAWGKLYSGKTPNEVILDPWQFSSFNANDPNFPVLLEIARNFDGYLEKGRDRAALKRCLDIATAVYTGKIPRNVKAIYYETLASHGLYDRFFNKLKRPPKIEKVVGHHRFYAKFG